MYTFTATENYRCQFLQAIVTHSNEEKEEKALLMNVKLQSCIWNSSTIKQVAKTNTQLGPLKLQ